MPDTTIRAPHVKVKRSAAFDMMRLSDNDYRIAQQRLVAAAMPDVDWATTPDAWNEYPIQRWCWHMLQLNGLDPDPDDHKPLTHWGIDLGFAPQSLRDFLFAIA